jgi:hypothetical protein
MKEKYISVHKILHMFNLNVGRQCVSKRLTIPTAAASGREKCTLQKTSQLTMLHTTQRNLYHFRIQNGWQHAEAEAKP